jgi:DNA-directed RNA polymerase specialized sigma24 family protein
VAAAQAAAAEGDAWGAVEPLYRSAAIEGFRKGVGRRWPKLPDDDIDFIVGGALEALHRAVSSGTKILRVGSYVYKVADQKAAGWSRLRASEVAYDEDDDWEDDKSLVAAWVVAADEASENRQLAEALSVARTLLPELGQDNLRSVMEVALDAIERGEEDLTSREIGEMLGLRPGTVRELRRRGFNRLEERARARRLVSPDFSLSPLRFRTDDEDDQDE